MFNRRKLLAGLGALFTVPFLPKIANGVFKVHSAWERMPDYEGREMWKVELLTPDFTLINGDSRTYFDLSTHRYGCVAVRPKSMLWYDRCTHIYCVSYKDRSMMIIASKEQTILSGNQLPVWDWKKFNKNS